MESHTETQAWRLPWQAHHELKEHNVTLGPAPVESGSSAWVIQHGVVTRLGFTLWISWYILYHTSKNTNKQFAHPKAFASISTLHRAHKSWFLRSFSLSCKVSRKWLNVKQRNLSTGPKLHSPHPTLYSAFLLRSFVKHQHRYKPSPMTTNIKGLMYQNRIGILLKIQNISKDINSNWRTYIWACHLLYESWANEEYLGKNTDSSRPCISRMSNKMHWKCCWLQCPECESLDLWQMP
jgi:hypothetical protein